MTETIKVVSRPAFAARAGAVLIIQGEDGPAVCMKVERRGLDFVRHYLVPLDPRPADGAGLTYLDPEDEVMTCAGQFRFVLGEAAGGSPGVGDVFTNSRGTFLKVAEHERFEGRKPLAYADLMTGEVRSRQEKAVKAVYPGWWIDGVVLDHDGKATLQQIREAAAGS